MRGGQLAFAPRTATIIKILCLIFIISENVDSHYTDYRGGWEERGEGTGDFLKVCSLLEWCFIISIGVSSDHSHLRCTCFAGSR